MIHYQLRCTAAHEFDGWFKSSAAFDEQAASGLVSCPTCADTNVRRALMAPRLARKGGVALPPPSTPPAAALPAAPAPAAQVQAAGGAMPDGVRAALHRLRGEVEKNCDYVGKDFAREARRIHEGEAEPRGIYGESTQEQAEALADDGIKISAIPWLPRSDS